MREGIGVLVIGGGPAGLAAAIAARGKGFQVTLVDAAKPPIDKACGEGLMPNTLAALSELGVALGSGDGKVFRGARLIDGPSVVEASFPAITGIGVRRTVLHQRMVERAQECGVSLLWNTPVSGLTQEGAILSGEVMRAKWVIGADGMQSRVRRWSGLDSNSRQPVRFAQRRHYRVKAWTDYVEIHWGKNMQAYVTPLKNDETCVVLISRNPRLPLEEAWREFPGLAGSLLNAELSSAERGAATRMCELKRICHGNVALTDAMATEKLDSYQQAHRRLARRPHRMGRLLLLLDRYPALRRRAMRGLAKDPELFARLLAVHQGEASPKFLAATGARLGWQFLAA